MRLLIIPAIAVLLTFSFGACKSSSSGKTFCDTACLKDSIIFMGKHELKPYVIISASDCIADTLTWSYKGMVVYRKMELADLLNNSVHITRG